MFNLLDTSTIQDSGSNIYKEKTNEPHKLKPPLAKLLETVAQLGSAQTTNKYSKDLSSQNLQMAYLSSQDMHLHACIDVTIDMPEMQPNPQNDTWFKFQLRIIAQF